MHNLKLRHVKRFGACVCVHVRVLMGRGCKNLLYRSAMSPWVANFQMTPCMALPLYSACLTQMALFVDVELQVNSWELIAGSKNKCMSNHMYNV